MHSFHVTCRGRRGGGGSVAWAYRIYWDFIGECPTVYGVGVSEKRALCPARFIGHQTDVSSIYTYIEDAHSIMTDSLHLCYIVHR